MQDDVTRDERVRENQRRLLDHSLTESLKPRPYQGGRWAVLISFVALIFSGISLYESVLKQARLTLYVGEIVRHAQQPTTNTDVFALPVTIANRGARDAAVTGLELFVTKGSGRGRRYVASYLGDNPAKDNSAFAPLSLPGRGSYSGSILFFPADKTNGEPPSAATGGSVPYRFCLTANADIGNDYGFFDTLLQHRTEALGFEAEQPWFASAELAAHRAVAMPVTNISRIKLDDGQAQICQKGQ